MRRSQNSPAGRKEIAQDDILGRSSRHKTSPWGRQVFVSSPGDFRILATAYPGLTSWLFPSVLPDCSVTSASFPQPVKPALRSCIFPQLFSPCTPVSSWKTFDKAFGAGSGRPTLAG